MAANPPLCSPAPGASVHFPLPYHGEQIYMSRHGVELKLEGPPVRTRSNRWSARGSVFLSNMRLVFVADKPDAASGLHAFELPLAYVSDEDFKQPIFAANNLSGRCYMVGAAPGTGLGSDPAANSVTFTLYFREGGVGTIVPFFFRSCAYVRSIASRMQQEAAAAAAAAYADPPPPAVGGAMGMGVGMGVGPEAPGAPPPPQQFLQTALVDPSDPTKVYLTQPVPSSQMRDDAPKYPAPIV